LEDLADLASWLEGDVIEFRRLKGLVAILRMAVCGGMGRVFRFFRFFV